MSKRELDRARARHRNGCRLGLTIIGIGGIAVTLALMLARDFDSALITSLMAMISGAVLWAQTPKEDEP